MLDAFRRPITFSYYVVTLVKKCVESFMTGSLFFSSLLSSFWDITWFPNICKKRDTLFTVRMQGMTFSACVDEVMKFHSINHKTEAWLEPFLDLQFRNTQFNKAQRRISSLRLEDQEHLHHVYWHPIPCYNISSMKVCCISSNTSKESNECIPVKIIASHMSVKTGL